MGNGAGVGRQRVDVTTPKGKERADSQGKLQSLMSSAQPQLNFSSFSPENDQKKAPEPAKEEKFTGKLLS